MRVIKSMGALGASEAQALVSKVLRPAAGRWAFSQSLNTGNKDMAILEGMPVRSVITAPADGSRLGGRKIELRGHAWAGDHEVRTVEVSIDHGTTWKPAKVNPPANKFAWQRFTATVDLPSAGYYEVWSRATDAAGKTQPFAATNWNPQGYGANPVTPVRVLAEA